jgi:hypothetical protein
MTAVKMLPNQFHAQKADIAAALTAGLLKELKDCAWQPDPDTDLWNLPTVDSKTVCKLSPIVEKMTGHKLQAKWVRKGGYESVENAVSDLMAHIGENCVAPAAVSIAAE